MKECDIKKAVDLQNRIGHIDHQITLWSKSDKITSMRIGKAGTDSSHGINQDFIPYATIKEVALNNLYDKREEIVKAIKAL